MTDEKMENVYDVIVIGAGPAGITAAIYLARRKLHILSISEMVGGQAVVSASIENYSGFNFITGPEFKEKLEEHAKAYGIISMEEKVLSVKRIKNIFEVKTNENTYHGKSVIIATGARMKKLNIKGEMEYIGKGVAYCATCDAPLFKNKEVAIIGGGDTALETAIQLKDYAKKIYVITRNEKMKGMKILIEKVRDIPAVEFIYSAETKEIRGGKFVKSIIIEEKKETRELNIQGIFINIGYEPNSYFVDVKKNNVGEIIINKRNETSEKGIFAAGDVTDIHVKQIIVSAGEGAIAAISASEYVSLIE